ncbi:MAG: metallopeptidase family protein [Candidatus Methylacidiphilales bacterium]
MKNPTPEVLEAAALAVIQKELDLLPDEVAGPVRRVAILLHAEPEDEATADCLGLFEGCSLSDPEPVHAQDMPRITFFLNNLWDEAGGQMRLFEDEVRITFRHEIGHYLGWNEEEVEQRGL